MEVWELLLGAAIKGSHRSHNINLIFQMDQALQAELVGIVSGIIDKFGQNTRKSLSQEDPQEPSQGVDNNEASKDRQIITELLAENEDLKETIKELEAELGREK